jgi:SP family facilitated glucose transporter-like MFS transporter 8
LIGLQSFFGIDAILFYSEIIIRKAGNNVIDPSIATITFGVFMLLSSFITPFLVDVVGRKCLLLVSAAGCGLSLAIIGTYFYYDEQYEFKNFELLPVIALIAFIMFYNLGFGPLPFTILSEMFAPEIKSPAVSFAVAVAWITTFVVTITFLPLEGIIHTYGNFWLFSGFCIIAFFFTAIFVFETKGLTLNQIQLELNKNYVILR